MAKKKVKAVEVKEEELKVAIQEEPVVADVVNEEEPVNSEVAEEQEGLQEEEAITEENLVETAEGNSAGPVDVDMNTLEEGTRHEEVPVDTAGEEIQQGGISAETAECDSVEPVDEEGNMEEVGTGTEEGLQDSNESLSDNSEDKEMASVVTLLSFRSDSEEARHYILEFLKDGESHKKSEVVAYITERAGKTFTEATIINVLRGMINSGSIISLERGCYSIGSGSGLLSKLVQFIEVTRCQLEKVATISVSDIKEEDYKAISELKSLKETLNAMYERLKDN